MATIYKPSLLYLGFLALLSTLRATSPSSLSLPPLHLALTLQPPLTYPVTLPFLPHLFLSFLENVDDDAFLDCAHEYRRLQSDVAYSVSGDASLPRHVAVNTSECNSST